MRVKWHWEAWLVGGRASAVSEAVVAMRPGGLPKGLRAKGALKPLRAFRGALRKYGAPPKTESEKRSRYRKGREGRRVGRAPSHDAAGALVIRRTRRARFAGEANFFSRRCQRRRTASPRESRRTLELRKRLAEGAWSQRFFFLQILPYGNRSFCAPFRLRLASSSLRADAIRWCRSRVGSC